MPKTSKYVYLGNIFSLFSLISYFWKFWPKKKKKNHFLAKISVFWGPKCQNFQKEEINQKNEKTFPRYMYLDGFGKLLVIFVQKFF